MHLRIWSCLQNWFSWDRARPKPRVWAHGRNGRVSFLSTHAETIWRIASRFGQINNFYRSTTRPYVRGSGRIVVSDCLAVVLSRTFLDEFYTKIIQEEGWKKIVDLDLNNSDLLTNVKPNALCKWTRERERERPALVWRRHCWRRSEGRRLQPRSDWLTTRSGQRSWRRNLPTRHWPLRRFAISINTLYCYYYYYYYYYYTCED